MAKDVSVHIRAMAPDDYDAVTDLWMATDGVFLADADTEPALTAYLKRNPTTSFVAIVNDRIIGAVLCGHDGRRASLHHLAICTEHRLAGVGRALVDACMNALTKEGISTSFIFVAHSNSDALAFWSRLGFDIQDSFVAYKRRT